MQFEKIISFLKALIQFFFFWFLGSKLLYIENDQINIFLF